MWDPHISEKKSVGGGGSTILFSNLLLFSFFFFSILLFRFYLRRRGAAPARGQWQAVRRRQRTAVGGLRQLQTLDIRHTSVVRLPAAIIKLHKLQYIRGGTKVTLGEEGTSASLAAAETETQPKCRSTHALLSWLLDLCRGRHAGDPCSGIEVPRGIEETALHTLGVINVGVAGGKAFLKELKNLTQLRKLGVSGINWKNIQELCSALSCHRYLESLSVRLDKDEQGSCDDKLKEDLRNRIAEHPNKLVLKLKME